MGQTTLRFVGIGNVWILLHTCTQPTDHEWDAMLAAYEQHAWAVGSPLRAMVLSEGGGPSSSQRARMNRLHRRLGIAPGVAVVLDGFDPDKRCGYVYVSHNDVDIVSDIGHGEELAFKQMYDMGQAFIMVIHDRDIDQLSTLEHRLDDFLRQVHRRQQKG